MDAVFRLYLHVSQFQPGSAYHTVALNLIKNIGDVPGKSIEQLAEICYTNPMTISRLARKLGYKSFGDFREDFMEASRGYPYMNRCIPIKHTKNNESAMVFLDFAQRLVEETRAVISDELCQEIARSIHSSESFHMYSSPFSPGYNVMLLHDVMLTGKEIHYHTAMPEAMEDVKTVTGDSFIMLIPGLMFAEKSDILKIFDKVKETGAKLFYLSDGADPLLPLAPGFTVPYDGHGTVSATFPYMFIMSMLIMTHRRLFLEEE